MQGEPREFREHSQESLDPMASMLNLYIQQRQNRHSAQELNQTTPSAPQTLRIQGNQEEANLITFTPIVEQQVPQVQGAAGSQEQPKQQRSPRKKKNSEWTLNQRQFDQNKTQEISHILPGEHLNVFNGEEPSVSYLQLLVKRKGKIVFVPDAVKWDMGDIIAKRQHGVNFAPQIHMLRKPVGGMKNS